jgi:predicted DNA-binding transcriptional regulator YafY
MPLNKSALLRYRIIDACLTNNMRLYPTLEQIQEKIESELDLSISTSMINKDFKEMKSIYSAPIQFDRTHKGYYYSEPDFSIKEFPLLEEEIAALDYSTALLHQLKGTKLFEQFESAINKVIEGYRISKIINKASDQIIQVEEPVKTTGGEWLTMLINAIVYKELLRVDYQGFGREAKTHQLSAYLLKEYRNRWYVAGYSNRSENVLIMALDRIQNIIPATEGSYHPAGIFEPAAFFKYSFGITQIHDAIPQKIVLQFTTYQAPYIISQPLHPSQKIESQNEEGLTISLELYITQELMMSILSYGKQVKVLEPSSLAKEIQSTIKAMAANYQ